MPRSVWNGSISLGLVNIPVKLYKATKDKVVEFNVLCAKCHSPLEYKRWCPNCKKEVAWEEVVKGYKVSKDKYIVLTKEELESISLKTIKAIEIIEFVDAGQIDPLFVSKNYYIVPQEGGEKAYTLFKQVLELTGKVAIGKVVMRNKEYLVAIRPYQKGMLLSILHYKDEIMPMENLEELEKLVVVKESELKLAKALIEKLSGEFDLEKYSDEYSKALKALIEKKLEGKEIEVKEEEKKEEQVDLLEALKASVQLLEKKKKSKE
jgi:DNA end-binding protein Ku